MSSLVRQFAGSSNCRSSVAHVGGDGRYPPCNGADAALAPERIGVASLRLRGLPLSSRLSVDRDAERTRSLHMEVRSRLVRDGTEDGAGRHSKAVRYGYRRAS